MLKSASLDAYWQDRPAAYFTIVRSIGTGGGVTPCAYNSLRADHKKYRSKSDPFCQPFNSCSKLRDQYGKLAEEVEVEPLAEDDSQPAMDVCEATCVSCRGIFDSSHMVVSFEGELYHISCFSCAECGKSVDPASQFLVLENGGPLCPQCSPVCQVCGERITRGHVGVLNKDFHEDCIKCFHCQKVFRKLSKIYACGSEPCCAECVAPVFGSAWNETNKGKRPNLALPIPDKVERTLSDPPKSEDTGAHTLPPRLESFSHAVSELPSAMFHTLLRPSFSFPTCLSDSPLAARKKPKLSLSSLRAILYDELGVSLLMNFCVEDSTIELILFWLDVEHFKYFDGNQEDTKLFAHHIMLKYIGYYAELPVGLPKVLEDQIVDDIQTAPSSQEVFNEAQSYVYEIMEKTILVRFLQSKDGQSYLQALVTRDIDRRKKQRDLHHVGPVTATVVSFDKRHLQTKFYVYSVQVEMESHSYMVYRRYSEFYALYQELKSTFKDEAIPPMPGKIFFGRSQTKAVAHQRLGDLNQFLQRVLAMPSEISLGSPVKQFLTQTTSDKDDEAFDTRIQSQLIS